MGTNNRHWGTLAKKKNTRIGMDLGIDLGVDFCVGLDLQGRTEDLCNGVGKTTIDGTESRQCYLINNVGKGNLLSYLGARNFTQGPQRQTRPQFISLISLICSKLPAA